jgi:GMP synthase-like glutamine amidotransferase
MHQDVVFEYPEGVEALAYTAKCKNHGMYVSKKLITVQGHPEFDGEIEKEILDTRHKLGIFDDATYEEAVSRADKYHDGVVISAVFLKFLLEE